MRKRPPTYHLFGGANSNNAFSAELESATTHDLYAVADEYTSSHVKSGAVLIENGDQYFVRVSSYGLDHWTIDVQVCSSGSSVDCLATP